MTIYEKIAKIQDEIQVVKNDSENPHFHNTYATYEKVIETIYPLLRKHKLVSLHKLMPPVHDGYIGVATTIRDVDGQESINSQFDIPFTKKDPQAAGSAITYAKRYSLLAMLGLGTEDDDAEGAVTGNYPPEPKHEGARVTPENDVMERAMSQGQKCNKCGAKMVKNPKTGKWFCEDKCWLKEK